MQSTMRSAMCTTLALCEPLLKRLYKPTGGEPHQKRMHWLLEIKKEGFLDLYELHSDSLNNGEEATRCAITKQLGSCKGGGFSEGLPLFQMDQGQMGMYGAYWISRTISTYWNFIPKILSFNIIFINQLLSRWNQFLV